MNKPLYPIPYRNLTSAFTFEWFQCIGYISYSKQECTNTKST